MSKINKIIDIVTHRTFHGLSDEYTFSQIMEAFSEMVYSNNTRNIHPFLLWIYESKPHGYTYEYFVRRIALTLEKSENVDLAKTIVTSNWFVFDKSCVFSIVTLFGMVLNDYELAIHILNKCSFVRDYESFFLTKAAEKNNIPLVKLFLKKNCKLHDETFPDALGLNLLREGYFTVFELLMDQILPYFKDQDLFYFGKTCSNELYNKLVTMEKSDEIMFHVGRGREIQIQQNEIGGEA